MAALRDMELAGRLIAFDTTSSKPNREMADFICNYLDLPGVDIREYHGPPGKLNLVIRVKGRRSVTRGLTLSGHMDVVPADPSGWDGDPFELQLKDGKMVARGSADMKSFLALCINRARRLAGTPAGGPLVLLLTYDEEVGLEGARQLQQTWDEWIPIPTPTIIGEPTNLKVVSLHKGHLKLRIKIKGQTAHSGYPQLGRNAIEEAGRVIALLVRLKEQLREQRYPSSVFFPETPFVTLNLGTIAGGDAINVVAGHCQLEIGLRLLPGVESDGIRRLVEDRLQEADVTVEMINCSPALDNGNSTLGRELSRRLGQQGPGAVSFASDAGILSQMGLDCVLFGPGSIEMAHKPNEHLPIEQFRKAGGILKELISHFCGSES